MPRRRRKKRKRAGRVLTRRRLSRGSAECAPLPNTWRKNTAARCTLPERTAASARRRLSKGSRTARLSCWKTPASTKKRPRKTARNGINWPASSPPTARFSSTTRSAPRTATTPRRQASPSSPAARSPASLWKKKSATWSLSSTAPKSRLPRSSAARRFRPKSPCWGASFKTRKR